MASIPLVVTISDSDGPVLITSMHTFHAPCLISSFQLFRLKCLRLACWLLWLSISPKFLHVMISPISATPAVTTPACVGRFFFFFEYNYSGQSQHGLSQQQNRGMRLRYPINRCPVAFRRGRLHLKKPSHQSSV